MERVDKLILAEGSRQPVLHCPRGLGSAELTTLLAQTRASWKGLTSSLDFQDLD